jgi:hypothetical protein
LRPSASNHPSDRLLNGRLLDLSRRDNSFAKEEIENGFNTIGSHHAITTCAAIETTIERTLVNLILKVPSSSEIIAKKSPNLNVKKIRTSSLEEAKRTIRIWEVSLPHSNSIDRITLHARGLRPSSGA